MKKNLNWLYSLALTTITTITFTAPSLATETNPTTASKYMLDGESIEIYVPPPETPGISGCSGDLRTEIDQIIQKYPSKWAILVEPLEGGEPLYYYNADLKLIPASNIKILTTAAALQYLSPNSLISRKSLREWIQVTNLRSNNYYAETLLRHIGGSYAVKQALQQLGVNSSSYRVADGSGLSRRNLASPRALVSTLRGMYYAQNNDVFLASLPVAGVSGTLRNRMQATPAEGTVYAKTGTLRGVRTLSGYINHPDYGTLVFSILANQPHKSGVSLVKAIDEMIVQLTQFRSCDSL